MSEGNCRCLHACPIYNGNVFCICEKSKPQLDKCIAYYKSAQYNFSLDLPTSQNTKVGETSDFIIKSMYILVIFSFYF
jgi:hypothetical protein